MGDVNAGDLHRLARLLREVALDATAKRGEDRVSAGDLAVAEDISRHPATSVGDIAARTGLAQSLVSRTISKMQAAGVVTSSADPADRRRTLTSIAPEGRTELLCSRARRSIEPALRARFPDASPEDVAHIIRLLQEVADLIRQ